MLRLYITAVFVCTMALGLAFGPYLPHPSRWLSLLNKPTITCSHPVSMAKLSIIIPSYNDGYEILSKTLESVVNNVAYPELIEIIVVDGGSNDHTMQAVKNYPSIITATSFGGRGPAINTGIRKASGDIILMLHSDCIVQKNFDQVLRQAFSDPNVVLTAFQFDPDVENNPSLQSLRDQVNFRSKHLWLPYGDQALAIRRKDLTSYLGGEIPNYKMMEDFEFVVRMRNIALDENKSIVVLPQAVISSPRRFLNKGLTRTTALNWFFVAAYVWGGKSPDQIFAWYYS